MRGFFSFLWLCVKIAPKGVREFVDIPATIVGIALPLLAWLDPSFWNSDKGQIKMNATFWMIPCGCAWLYLAIRAFLSPYLVFREARDEWSLTESKLRSELDRELVKNTPQLSGAIENIAIDRGLAIIMLQIGIGNLGAAPSIAEGFRLILYTNERGYELDPRVLPSTMNLPFPSGEGTLTLTAKDAIWEKAAAPITQGNKVRGWAMYSVPQFLLAQIDDVISVSVRFQDVTQRQCTADAPLTKFSNVVVPRYLPGAGELTLREHDPNDTTNKEVRSPEGV